MPLIINILTSKIFPCGFLQVLSLPRKDSKLVLSDPRKFIILIRDNVMFEKSTFKVYTDYRNTFS